MNWDYLQPVKIYFGKGRVHEIKKIAQELGCARGLLVAGPFFFKSGLAEKIMKELDIAESRRLKGLGERQQKALLERLG